MFNDLIHQRRCISDTQTRYFIMLTRFIHLQTQSVLNICNVYLKSDDEIQPLKA